MEDKKVLISEILNSWYGFYDLNLIDLHLKVGIDLKRSLREELQIIFDSEEIIGFETAIDFFLAVEEAIVETIENKAKRWSPSKNMFVWLGQVIESVCEKQKQVKNKRFWFGGHTPLTRKKTKGDINQIDIRTLSCCKEIDEKIKNVLEANAFAQDLISIYENYKLPRPLSFEELANQMGQSLMRINRLDEMLKTLIRTMIS